MNARPPTLRRQIIASFLFFSACVSLLFASASFLTAYVVEDTLLREAVRSEIEWQKDQWSSSGRLAPTRLEFVSIHRDSASMPKDLKQQFSAAGPREEYRGREGRHYHVLPFTLPDGQRAFAVAEVSQRLAVRSLRRELVLLLVIGSLAILLLAAAVGYWLAIRATAPLTQLANAVSGREPGDVPAISIADFPDNEVGLLARTLARMLERTRAFVEREGRFTREASHELRTPISVIRSSVELIEAKGGVPAQLAAPMERIARAVRQMEQSVDLLLLLAREEQAQSPEQDLPLLPIVEQIVVTESERHDASAFTVTVSIPAASKVRFNEAVTSTILANLVGNAFQHNQGGDLAILVDHEDVVIRDTGRGIPEDLVESLADDPGEPVRRRGFGLAIVQRLCRVHSIPFTVRSSESGTEARVGLLRGDV